jgi:hypothetical protein
MPEEWYESAVASHFTLEIGYYNGERGRRAAQTLLLHQSPLDEFFGDAASGIGSRYFLTEFKRDVTTLDSERRKPLRRTLQEELTAGIPLVPNIVPHTGSGTDAAEGEHTADPAAWIADLSLRGHFLCWGRERGRKVSADIAPYACLVTALPSRYQWSGVARFLNAVDPSSASAGHETLIGLRVQEFSSYVVHMLALVLLEKEDGSSDEDAPSGDEIADSTMLLGRASKTGIVALPVRGTNMLLRLLSINQNVEVAIKAEVDRIREERAARARTAERGRTVK